MSPRASFVYGRLRPLMALGLVVAVLFGLSWTAQPTPATAAPIGDSLYHPVVHKNFAGNHTTISLQNSSFITTTAYIYFYPLAGGSPVHQQSAMLAPLTSMVIDGQNIGGLPNNTYTVLVTDSIGVGLTSVASTVDNLGRAGSYMGIPDSQAGFTTYLGPLFEEGFNSFVILQNTTPNPTTVSLFYYNLDGTVAHFENINLDPLSQFQANVNSNVNLPAGFTGYAHASSGDPIVGLAKLVDAVSGEVTYKGTMNNAWSSEAGSVPRIANQHVQEEFYEFTTDVVVVNSGADPTQVTCDVHRFFGRCRLHNGEFRWVWNGDCLATRGVRKLSVLWHVF
jgi:hypothetical protein